MTTNEMAMYNAEYYDASAADESDPDPLFVIETDNLDDVHTIIMQRLRMHVHMNYLDTYDGFDRYGINDMLRPSVNLGVVVIGVV